MRSYYSLKLALQSLGEPGRPKPQSLLPKETAGKGPEKQHSGSPYDNSSMESFFASLKKEYFYRREYAAIQDVERDLFYYIEVFYNRKRLHSSLGYMSPVAYRMKKMGQRAG